MKTGNLIKHQIKVEITNNEGVIRISLPDDGEIVWPIKDDSVTTGTFYLSLTPLPQLPTKEELARQVLREILQKGE